MYLELLYDVCYALGWRGFKGEHGVVAIEGCELSAVAAVKGLVVELDELLYVMLAR